MTFGTGWPTSGDHRTRLSREVCTCALSTPYGTLPVICAVFSSVMQHYFYASRYVGAVVDAIGAEVHSADGVSNYVTGIYSTDASHQRNRRLRAEDRRRAAVPDGTSIDVLRHQGFPSQRTLPRELKWKYYSSCRSRSGHLRARKTRGYILRLVCS